MREWKLYLKCLWHNRVALWSFVGCIGGICMMTITYLIGGGPMQFAAAVGVTMLSLVSVLVYGAGADTYGQYLITRRTINGPGERPKHIRISERLSRPEQVGAELACRDYGVAYK